MTSSVQSFAGFIPWFAVLIVACHPPQSRSAPLQAPAPQLCQIRLPNPDIHDLPRAEPLKPVQSQFAAELAVPLSTLTSRISQEVPIHIAAAKNVDVGSAGRLAYTIRRGPLVVSQHDETIHVSTHLFSHVELCKPLGPLGCVTYATCDPTAAADLSVPIVPNPDYSLGPSRVSITVIRPCGLGPIDATQEIQRGADRQAAQIRTRIDQMLPSVAPVAQALWNASHLDLPLQQQSHYRFSPQRIVLGTTAIRNDSLSTVVGIVGVVEPGTSTPSAQLPQVQRQADLLPQTVVRVPLLIDFSTIATHFADSIGHPLSMPTSSQGTASIQMVLPHDRELVVVLRLDGQVCGLVPFIAKPMLDQDRKTMRLGSVRMLESYTRSLQHLSARVDASALANLLASHARLPLPSTADDVATIAAAATDRLLLGGLSAYRGAHDVSIDDLIVTPDGIVALARVAQYVRVDFR